MHTINTGIACGDTARLRAATHGRFGTRYPVRRFYDDGFGPVWIYQDAGGLLGIIRAQSWESAWEIVTDEILDDADPDYLADPGYAVGADELPEGCGYRSSGNGSKPWNQTPIYQEDMNGSQLDLLTPETMEELGIILQWVSWDDDDDSSPAVEGK